MPTCPINYANTIIYKLCCKDPEISDIYIGHTTNFTRRKQEHKKHLYNPKSNDYNCYKSIFIRDHGGWDNWDMIEICKVSCLDVNEARRIERQHIEGLKATLNKNIPSRTMDEWWTDHKEEINETRRQYRSDHPEEMKEKDRHRYIAESEVRKARQKKYYANHAEDQREKRRQYWLEHKDEIAEKRRLKAISKKMSHATL